MGLTNAKFIPHLEIGVASSGLTEDKLKKANYTRIVTTDFFPDEPKLTWKLVKLDDADDSKNLAALMSACEFIQKCRMDKENVLLLISTRYPDRVVVASAYTMVLSGLAPQLSHEAVKNAIKSFGLSFTDTYMKSLELLRQSDSPQALRGKIFSTAKPYSISLLTGDITQIYQFANLPNPSTDQVKLTHLSEETTSPPNASGAPAPVPEDTMSTSDATCAVESVTIVSQVTSTIPEQSPATETRVEQTPSKSEDVGADFKKLLSKTEDGSNNEQSSVVPSSTVETLMKVTHCQEQTTPAPLSNTAIGYIDESTPVYIDYTYDGSLDGQEDEAPIAPPIAPVPVGVVHSTPPEQPLPPSTKPALKLVGKQPRILVNDGPVNDVSGVHPLPPPKRKVMIIKALIHPSASLVKEVDDYLASTTEEQRRQNRQKITIIRSPQATVH